MMNKGSSIAIFLTSVSVWFQMTLASQMQTFDEKALIIGLSFVCCAFIVAFEVLAEEYFPHQEDKREKPESLYNPNPRLLEAMA